MLIRPRRNPYWIHDRQRIIKYFAIQAWSKQVIAASRWQSPQIIKLPAVRLDLCHYLLFVLFIFFLNGSWTHLHSQKVSMPTGRIIWAFFLGYLLLVTYRPSLQALGLLSEHQHLLCARRGCVHDGMIYHLPHGAHDRRQLVVAWARIMMPIPHISHATCLMVAMVMIGTFQLFR
jgi:hypothetical protein